MTDVYPLPQINSLVKLLLKLCAELPKLKWIAGHESLDTSQVQASDNPDTLRLPQKGSGPPVSLESFWLLPSKCTD